VSRPRPINKLLVARVREQLKELVGPHPAQTLRAKLSKDGVWVIRPYGDLAAFEIAIDEERREVRGLTQLFQKRSEVRRDGRPKRLPFVVDGAKIPGGLTRESIVALSTFSGVPVSKVIPFVKREALRKLHPLVIKVHAQVDNRLSDTTVAHVWKHLDEFQELEEKAPSLIPIAFYNVSYCSLDLIHRWFMNSGAGTRAMWRYLLRMPLRAVRDIQQETSFFRNLKLLADTGETPRSTTVRHIRRLLEYALDGGWPDADGGRPIDERVRTLTPVIRSFIREARRSRSLGLLNRELRDFTDYLIACSRDIAQMDANQLSVPWRVWQRRSAEWHRNVGNGYARMKRENLTWESALTAVKKDGYEAIALTSTEVLTEEGVEMHHCVAGYDVRCIGQGLSFYTMGIPEPTGQVYARIFSIRKKGKRVATLELSVMSEKGTDFRSVKVAQVRGPCNATPSDAIQAFASHVASEYLKAVSGQSEAREPVGELVAAGAA